MLGPYRSPTAWSVGWHVIAATTLATTLAMAMAMAMAMALAMALAILAPGAASAEDAPAICTAVAVQDGARDLDADIARARELGGALIAAGDLNGGNAVRQVAETLALFRSEAPGVDTKRQPGSALEALRERLSDTPADASKEQAITAVRSGVIPILGDYHAWIQGSSDVYAIGETQQILSYAYGALGAPEQRRTVSIDAACRAGAIVDVLPATEEAVAELLPYGFELNRASRIEPELWNWARRRILDWLERKGAGLEDPRDAVFVAATLAIPTVDPDSRALSRSLLDWAIETMWVRHEARLDATETEYIQRTNTIGGVVRLMIGFMIGRDGEPNLEVIDVAYVDRFERAVRLMRENALRTGGNPLVIDEQTAKLIAMARRLKQRLTE